MGKNPLTVVAKTFHCALCNYLVEVAADGVAAPSFGMLESFLGKVVCPKDHVNLVLLSTENLNIDDVTGFQYEGRSP